ncbi:hypothetical protein Bca4012_059509 [Brassica carinata]|uniref:FAS1 domain-containing protein n=1 Tax=Brassica carinata TaxID=52824 RepID=A0A8X7V6A8_BRACI|nr:hypothetical protein Bca52824_029962 [Brassica carinata]
MVSPLLSYQMYLTDFHYSFKYFLSHRATLNHFILENIFTLAACHYQKLSHHYNKVRTGAILHDWGKKNEGRSKGFRLNRPKKLLKALVFPRRFLSIYSSIMRYIFHIIALFFFFFNQEITFLMPSDEDLSHAGMSQESLETFILRHTTPAWLMINHMLRFPNKTLVPCIIPDKMFTITKSGGSGLFVNNARIVSHNICQNSPIPCHGAS